MKRLRPIALLAISFLAAGCCNRFDQRMRTSALQAHASAARAIIPLVGAIDLAYATESFARQQQRWPKHYGELTEFVSESKGYLSLWDYKDVRFVPQRDRGVEISWLSSGKREKIYLPEHWPAPDEPIETINPFAALIKVIADNFDFYSAAQILYAASSFRSFIDRWPASYSELQRFVADSEYLHLPQVDGVNLFVDATDQLELSYRSPRRASPMTITFPAASRTWPMRYLGKPLSSSPNGTKDATY